MNTCASKLNAWRLFYLISWGLLFELSMRIHCSVDCCLAQGRGLRKARDMVLEVQVSNNFKAVSHGRSSFGTHASHVLRKHIVTSQGHLPEVGLGYYDAPSAPTLDNECAETFDDTAESLDQCLASRLAKDVQKRSSCIDDQLHKAAAEASHLPSTDRLWNLPYIERPEMLIMPLSSYSRAPFYPLWLCRMFEPPL